MKYFCFFWPQHHQLEHQEPFQESENFWEKVPFEKIDLSVMKRQGCTALEKAYSKAIT